MSAFDRGRPGVWHSAIYSFKPTDGVCVDGYNALGITDVFMDPFELNPQQPQTSSGDPNYMLTPALKTAVAGFGFHPQLFDVHGTRTPNGMTIAKAGLAAITRLSHQGAIQFDVEPVQTPIPGGDEDVQLATTICGLIDTFRAQRLTFTFCINTVARKSYVLGGVVVGGRTALDRIRNDPFAYLRIQLGLGNEEGLADIEQERYEYVTQRLLPEAKLSFTYPVAIKDPATGDYGPVILPDTFNGKPDGTLLKGDIFDSNLLRKKGLA